MRILRVDADVEARGIDIAKHGEPAYPAAAMGHGWDTEGRKFVKMFKCIEGIRLSRMIFKLKPN